MLLYQKTRAAETILQDGFPDGQVRLADIPLALDVGTNGGIFLALHLPADVLSSCQLADEEKPYKEFLIPADLANRYGPPWVCCELCTQLWDVTIMGWEQFLRGYRCSSEGERYWSCPGKCTDDWRWCVI
jgi:hypothetical protein